MYFSTLLFSRVRRPPPKLVIIIHIHRGSLCYHLAAFTPPSHPPHSLGTALQTRGKLLTGNETDGEIKGDNGRKIRVRETERKKIARSAGCGGGLMLLSYRHCKPRRQRPRFYVHYFLYTYCIELWRFGVSKIFRLLLRRVFSWLALSDRSPPP